MMNFLRRQTSLLSLVGLPLLILLGCKAIQGVQVQFNPPTEPMGLNQAAPKTIEPPSGKDNESPGLAGNWPNAAITPGVGLNQHFEPLGQLGGNTYGLAISDRYIYLGAGPRLMVVDMDGEAGAEIVGYSAPLPGVVRGVVLQPPYAYVASGKGGLRVLDISDPTHPTEVGSLEGMQWAMSVVRQDDRLYIADNALGLAIIDMTDPLHPTLLGTTSLKQPAAGLAVRGDTVYVVHMTGGLVAIDVSNASAPVILSEFALPQMSAAVTLVGDYALVAAGMEGLWVLNISNPAEPRKVAVHKTTYADGITQSDGTAYLTDFVNGLLIFDITDPANPQQVGALPLTLFSQQVPGQRQLVAGNGRVVLANPNQGLMITDVSNPGKPVLAAEIDAPLSGSALDVVSDESIAYVTRDFIGLGSADTSNPDQLRFLTSETSFVNGAPVRTSWKFALNGDYAYLADVNLGFRVLDLGSFEQVAGIKEPRSWSSLILGNGLAYATTTAHDPKEGDPEALRSLRVVDISDPLHPDQVGLLKMDNNAQALAVQGDYLYYPDMFEMMQLSNGSKSSLHVIDITNPASPVQVGEIETTDNCSQASSIVIKDRYAFIGDRVSGLCVFDISVPIEPELVYLWQEPLQIYDMALVDQRIYAAAYGYVAAIDISNPTSPILEDITVTPGLAWGIDAVGDRIYVADMDGGLNLLQYR